MKKILHNVSIVGNIAIYDKTNNKIIHCKPVEYSQETYPEENYIPIGIVVIPSKHTDDGKDIIMSLAVMSSKHPDTGEIVMPKGYISHLYMTMGGFKKTMKGYTKKPKLPFIGIRYPYKKLVNFGENRFVDLEEKQKSEKLLYKPFLFSTNHYNDIINPNNFYEGYNKNDIIKYDKWVNVHLMPSPYTINGEKNPKYFQKYTHNILSDFDGSIICKKLLEQLEDDEWKSSPTIDNNSFSKGFPYIQTCWRYHTDGTKQGDWYAPSVGEIGYICAKYNEIRLGYLKMKEFNKTFVTLKEDKETRKGFGGYACNYFKDDYGIGYRIDLSRMNYEYGRSLRGECYSLALCRVNIE